MRHYRTSRGSCSVKSAGCTISHAQLHMLTMGISIGTKADSDDDMLPDGDDNYGH